jgi:hypothetical protein
MDKGLDLNSRDGMKRPSPNQLRISYMNIVNLSGAAACVCRAVVASTVLHRMEQSLMPRGQRGAGARQ